jgi:hypothetical protein
VICCGCPAEDVHAKTTPKSNKLRAFIAGHDSMRT